MKSIPEYELKAETVHQMMLETRQNHLSLKTEGYGGSTEQVLKVLLKAVAAGSSLEAVGNHQPDGIDGNTLREQLNAALDGAQLRQQEAEMNQALASAIRVALPRGGVEVAIDPHDEPFYGKTAELLTDTRKGKAKAGTTRFFRIATADLIGREVRLRLATTSGLPEDDLPSVIRRLRQRLVGRGFHATMLYLDQGFWSGEVIRHLQQVGPAAVFAVCVAGAAVNHRLHL